MRLRVPKRSALEVLERRILMDAGSLPCAVLNTGESTALTSALSGPGGRFITTTEWNGNSAESVVGEWVAVFERGSDVARNWARSVSAPWGASPGPWGDIAESACLNVQPLSANSVLLTTSHHVDGRTLEHALARVSGFRYLEPNFVMRATTLPNDTSFPLQYALHNVGQTSGTPDADIDATEAWALTPGVGSVVVGVIDSGVNYNHVDLAANMWTNPGEIPLNSIDDDLNGYIDDFYGYDFVGDGDSDPFDDHSHGTHVAGTIAAVGNNSAGVTGVSWNAKIMALKFLDAGGSGTVADAIEAINYATMMKRDYGVNIRATNNSWGGGNSPRHSTTRSNPRRTPTCCSLLLRATKERTMMSPVILPPVMP